MHGLREIVAMNRGDAPLDRAVEAARIALNVEIENVIDVLPAVEPIAALAEAYIAYQDALKAAQR